MSIREALPKNPFVRIKSRYLVFATSLAVNLLILLPLWTFELAGWLPKMLDPVVVTVLDIASRCAISGAILWMLRSEGLKLSYLFGRGLFGRGLSGQGLSGRRLSSSNPLRFSLGYGLLLVLSLLVFSLGSASVFFYLLSLALPDYAGFILENTSVLEDIESQIPWLYDGLILLLVLAIAPVVEELIFRGVLLQRWATKWGMPKALAASSVLFGLLHLNNPVGLTLFGLVMGLLYVRTRSLWVPIVCHALNNLAAVGIAFLSGMVASDEVAVTLEDVQADWWVGLVLMLVAMPFLFRFVRQSWPKLGAAIPYVANSMLDSNV